MSVSGHKTKRLFSLPYLHAFDNFEGLSSWNTSCLCIFSSLRSSHEIENGGLSNSAINLRDRAENKDIVNSQQEERKKVNNFRTNSEQKVLRSKKYQSYFEDFLNRSSIISHVIVNQVTIPKATYTSGRSRPLPPFRGVS